MSLSFVGSSKCYIFVKFVTATLYQQNLALSIGFAGIPQTSIDIYCVSISYFFSLPAYLLIIL